MNKEEIRGGNYLAIGLGVGLVLGSAFSNVGLWLGIGGVIGIFMEWKHHRKPKDKDE